MSQDTKPDDAHVNRIVAAIEEVGISANELDRNAENANVVDGLFAISRAIQRLASAVEDMTPQGEGTR